MQSDVAVSRCWRRPSAWRRTNTPIWMCSRCWARWTSCWPASSGAFRPMRRPLHRLRMLNQFFFRDLSFGGNVNDYYDPDNSYLNVVLRTRRGIPDLTGRAVAGAGAGPGAERAGRRFSGALHGQGQPAQGPGGDRPVHRPVAQPRGTGRPAGALQAAQRPGGRVRGAAGPVPAGAPAARDHWPHAAQPQGNPQEPGRLATVGLALEGQHGRARRGAGVRRRPRVGRVTSGGFSPSLSHPIAMAYVDAALAAPGTALEIDSARQAARRARVVPMPFVPHRYYR